MTRPDLNGLVIEMREVAANHADHAFKNRDVACGDGPAHVRDTALDLLICHVANEVDTMAFGDWLHSGASWLVKEEARRTFLDRWDLLVAEELKALGYRLAAFGEALRTGVCLPEDHTKLIAELNSLLAAQRR